MAFFDSIVPVGIPRERDSRDRSSGSHESAAAGAVGGGGGGPETSRGSGGAADSGPGLNTAALPGIGSGVPRILLTSPDKEISPVERDDDLWQEMPSDE